MPEEVDPNLLAQLNAYQQHVQQYYPHYALSQGAIGPLYEMNQKQQMRALRALMPRQRINASNLQQIAQQWAKMHRATPYKPKAQGDLWSQLRAVAPNLAPFKGGVTDRTVAASSQQVNKLLSQLAKGGIVGPLNQGSNTMQAEELLAEGLLGPGKKIKPGKNEMKQVLGRAEAASPKVQGYLEAKKEQPTKDFMNYLNTTYGPQIDQTVQGLNFASQIVDIYTRTDKAAAKRAILESAGLTSIADAYRGLTQFLPKDVPITGASLKQAADNLQTQRGRFEEMYRLGILDAKSRGSTITDEYNAAQTIGPSSNQLDTAGLDPQTQAQLNLLYLFMQGGALGVSSKALKQLQSQLSGIPAGANPAQALSLTQALAQQAASGS